MKRLWSIAAATALGAGLIVGPAGTAAPVVLFPQDPNRQCGWPINYPGTANYAFPDTDAAYFVQAAVIGPGEQIVISGRTPKARYWSLQTYRFSDSTLIDSVNDVTVRPKGKRGAKKRQWTITVTSPDRDNGRNPNVLSAAGDFDGSFGSNLTVIMYRVYVSGTRTPSGGPMPSVTVRSKDPSGKLVNKRLKPCRKGQVGLPDNRPNLTPETSETFDFIRGPAARFYPSADTSYLIATAPYRPDEILVMTGKAPRQPRDVRYWSVCQNVNADLLPVVDCLRDDQVALTGDRDYAIAVVTQEQRDRLPGQQWAGVNFLDWGQAIDGTFADAFLIYRNILPSRAFAGSAERVPIGELAEPIIGDYAPALERLSFEEFQARYGSSGS